MAAAFIGVAAIAGWAGRQGADRAVRDSSPAMPVKAGPAPLYWYDPMVPDQHFDRPGKSPFMDMQLVPKYADPAAASTTTSTASSGPSTIVSIDPRMAQNLGMRTATVRAGSIAPRIEASGSVMIDERRIVAVEARAAGWVERLDVRAVGTAVQRGQVLAGFYAPELFAAQQELALARRTGDTAMIAAARSRLALLGVQESAAGAQRRVDLVAPQSGIVTELLVREGEQLTPGMPLMRLADLSQVWINVEIPEAQSASIHAGLPAQARLASMPGRVFDGTVDYVYPMLDTSTRTLRARLVFDNADAALRPGAYAQVSLNAAAQTAATLVPTEAVIRTGTRSVVIVAEAQGRYRPVNVTPGGEQHDETVILDGLKAGDEVLTSGQFLIDSEASLLGAYNRMEDSTDRRGDAQP